MKKLFTAVFVTALLLVFAALPAAAQEEFSDGDFTYTVNDDGTATITGTTKTEGG